MEQVQELIDHPHRFQRALSDGLDTAADMITSYGFKVIGALIILGAVGIPLAGYLMLDPSQRKRVNNQARKRLG